MTFSTVATGMVDSHIGAEPTARVKLHQAGLPEPFRKPWHERKRIITRVCDRLVGDLDSSLHAVRELCSSLDSGLPGESGETTKSSS
jgi:hypothetical protein